MQCNICEKKLRKNNKSGLCTKHYLIWWEKNKRDKVKKSLAHKKWYIINKHIILKKQSEYRLKNKNYFNLYEKNRKNKKERSKKVSEYVSLRLKKDLNFKLRYALRTRLYLALKGNYKYISAVNDLGCSIEDLKKHISSKFIENMSWNNWGEWEIDHIRPLCSFNLKNKKEQKMAAHFSNLQPLWKKENRIKGSTYGKDLR